MLKLVYRLLNPLSFVAFKMGHLRGGPSRTGAQGAYLDRYVTDEQRSSRLFGVARSTGMIQITALRSRLEKQPTDLRRSSRDLGDGTLVRSGQRTDQPIGFADLYDQYRPTLPLVIDEVL
jgi:hypothetical protein